MKKWPIVVFGSLLIAKFMFEDIVSEANKYVSEKEKLNNSGFLNAQLEKDMRSVGWTTGASWCVYFTKLMWKKGLSIKFPKHWKLAEKLIVGNSQDTWDNFQKDTSGKFELSKNPKAGSIAIWQDYENNIGIRSGHAGIVEKYSSTNFNTIEGNTNNAGGSNGDGVYKKIRTYNFNSGNRRLRGFINIKA